MTLDERDLDVRVFASLLGQDLDAEVIVFMGGVAGIVAVHPAIEDDRACTRRLRLAGHTQFLGQNWLESDARAGWGCGVSSHT